MREARRAAPSAPPPQVGRLEPPLYWMLSRTNSTIGVLFTFDPQMTFQRFEG